jgi:hypothetical protein
LPSQAARRSFDRFAVLIVRFHCGNVKGKTGEPTAKKERLFTRRKKNADRNVSL